MPLSFQIIDGVGVFLTEGDVEYEEGLAVFQAGLEAIFQRPVGQRLVLFDLLQSRESRSADEIRALAAVTQQALGSARMALVASQPLVYGMSRMFGAYVQHADFEVGVFHERAAAVAWLTTPPA